MDAADPYADRLADIPVVRAEVEVCGAVTAYWTYGRADAAVTIVAVHGFRGEHHGMAPIAAHLPDMRVIVPDLPGFGQSPPLPHRTHDVDAYAQWLTAFVAEVAPGSVVLGHSFGSIVVAAAVASGMPAPRVVLVNPIGAPALQGPRGILTRLAVLYYRLGAALPRRAGEALLRSRVIVRIMSVSMLKTTDPVVRRFAHAQHDAYFSQFADRDVLHDAFVASVSHDVREFATRISRPTLLVAAQRDDITPIEKERDLAAALPDARLVELPDVGHLIHYETPAAAAAAIRRFVSPTP